MRVKDLIKFLSDFNPNAELMNNIDPSWYTGKGESVERDIEQEKLDALRLWLWNNDVELR